MSSRFFSETQYIFTNIVFIKALDESKNDKTDCQAWQRDALLCHRAPRAVVDRPMPQSRCLRQGPTTGRRPPPSASYHCWQQPHSSMSVRTDHMNPKLSQNSHWTTNCPAIQELKWRKSNTLRPNFPVCEQTASMYLSQSLGRSARTFFSMFFSKRLKRSTRVVWCTD